MSGFKNFIMRGNLVQLAVAVVIGAQFSGLVKQFVSSFIDPLLALAGGTPNFATLSFKVHKATFTYGAFLTDVLSFLIAALVVYFVLVVPVTRLIAFMERNKAATEKDCPVCTMSIPINAQRCPECTSMLVEDSSQSQPAGQSTGVLAPPSYYLRQRLSATPSTRNGPCRLRQRPRLLVSVASATGMRAGRWRRRQDVGRGWVVPVTSGGRRRRRGG